MKKTLSPYAPFIAFFLTALLITLWNPFSRADAFLQDLLYQMPGKIMGNLYILDGAPTDEAQLRQEAAALITALNQDPGSRPAVIGLDIPVYSGSDADDGLTQAVLQVDNVVLPSLIHFDHQIIRDGNRLVLSSSEVSGVQHAFQPLDTLTHGFTNLFLDRDGKARRSLLQTDFAGEDCIHFAYAVSKKYAGKKLQAPPLDRQNMWYVDYSGKPGAFHVGVTWRDVLDGKVPASSFQGAIVLLAAQETLYPTPLGQETSTEIYANMIQDLVQGVHKRAAPVALQMLLLFLMLFGCRLANQRGLMAGVLVTAAGGVLWPVMCMVVYRFGLLLDPFYPPLWVLALFAGHQLWDRVMEFHGRVLVRRKLRRYLSQETANRLLVNHVSLEKPEKREIAVLFVDIRGFTPLSESLAPSQMAEVLKEYLTLTSSAIFHNGGTLDKFIGDATMGFFNAPLEQEDYVYHAVKAALEIAAGGERIRKTFYDRFGRNIYFGIGVHFGSAVVGEIGPDYRKDYTAVGDTVNTASRLESNAKPGEVLVSLKVCEALEGRMKASFVGERAIKGKSKPMLLYRVESLDGVASPSPAPEDPRPPLKRP